MDEDMKLYNLISNLVDGEVSDILMFFKSVDSKLSDDLREQIRNLLLQLHAELDCLQALIVANPSKRERIGYSAHKAKKITKRSKSLEEWHVRFLRRATVFIFFGNLSPDAKQKTVQEAADRAVKRIERIRAAVVGTAPEDIYLGTLPDKSAWTEIEGSAATVLAIPNVGDSIAEFRSYGSATDVNRKNASRYVVQELASRLANVKPNTMGMLRSAGFYDEVLKNRFVLRFELPNGKRTPKSLQSLLMDPVNIDKLVHSLSDRVRLAKKVASGLLFLHAGGFVHKKISSANILVFGTTTETYPNHVGEPFLTGFDALRKADDASARLEVKDWRQNLYLHPARHRLQPGDEFTMLHDIYSLGVVLLEIACWSAFTDRSRIGKTICASETVRATGQDVVKYTLLGPDRLKEQYIRLAEKRIPPVLGSTYCEVVTSCLRGLPNDDGTLPDSGRMSSSAYIEQVMGRLEEINV